MTRWQVSGIPEGRVGRFSIMYCTTHRGHPSWLSYVDYANIPSGTYTVLFEHFGQNDSALNIMQDTPREYEEHSWMLDKMSGDVLIAGLGVGMVNVPLLASDDVTSVTIVEKNQDVIDLVWDHCAKDDRFTLVHDDINTWEIPEGSSWDVAWFDTWMTYDELLPEYITRIQNKYGDYVEQMSGWHWEEVNGS